MRKPLVSICCLAYNHEKYLRECLEGFVSQKTDFDTEVLIHDDASTDGTTNIIREYENKYPELIKPIYQTENQFSKGVKPTFVYNFPRTKGKYIAMCEGDDYWTDPLKLQKQVDFLEENPDYTFSMGRVDMLIEQTGEIRRRKEHINPNKFEYFTLKDYLKGPFSQTSSFVFRNDRKPFPNWISKVHAGDQSLVVFKTGLQGKIKYHKELLSIYRQNESSVSHTVSYNVYEKFLSTLIIWRKHLKGRYKYLFFLLHYKYKSKIQQTKHTNFFLKVYFFVKSKSIDFILKFI